VSESHPIQQQRSGVSLIELLVVIAVIAALASLTVPAWGAITRSRANHAALSLVMGTLEQARLAATTGKKETWVLFRNNDSLQKASLRIVTRESAGLVPLGNWTMLPQGITFQTGENSLMDQKPTEEAVAAAQGSKPAAGISLGGVMFQRSGRIGMPQQGGSALSVLFKAKSPPIPDPIMLSRATGRASCQ
jgi:prepilin-type N-terminal cleavage/methylation domain-containing protein